MAYMILKQMKFDFLRSKIYFLWLLTALLCLPLVLNSQNLADPFDMGNAGYKKYGISEIKLTREVDGRSEGVVNWSKYDGYGSEIYNRQSDGKTILFNHEYNADSSIRSQEVIGNRVEKLYQTITTRNANGSMKQVEYYVPIPYVGKLIEQFEYDSQNRLIARSVKADKERTRGVISHYHYNKKGILNEIRLVSYEDSKDDSTILYHIKHVYNQKKQLQQKVFLTPSNDSIALAYYSYLDGGKEVVFLEAYDAFNLGRYGVDLLELEQNLTPRYESGLLPVIYWMSHLLKETSYEGGYDFIGWHKRFQYNYDSKGQLLRMKYIAPKRNGMHRGSVHYQYDNQKELIGIKDTVSVESRKKGEKKTAKIISSTIKDSEGLKIQFSNSKSYYRVIGFKKDTLMVYSSICNFAELIQNELNKERKKLIKKTYPLKPGTNVYSDSASQATIANFDQNDQLISEYGIAGNDTFSIREVERNEKGKMIRERINNYYKKYVYLENSNLSRVIVYESKTYKKPISQWVYTYDQTGACTVTEEWLSTTKRRSSYAKDIIQYFDSKGVLIKEEVKGDLRKQITFNTYLENGLLDQALIDFDYKKVVLKYEYTFFEK